MTGLKSEKGVFFALTAILAASLLGAIFFLGINTFIIRRASLELRRSADSICRQLIQSPPALSYDTVLHFQKIINTLPDFYPANTIKLTEARLILPTMPRGDFTLYDGNFNTSYESYLRDSNILSGKFYQNWQGKKFTELDSDLNCQNSALAADASFDCVLQTHLLWGNEEYRKYPLHMWNNYDNAGNTIGCELKADVHIFGLKLPFFEEEDEEEEEEEEDLESVQKISARTAVWSKVRGEFANYLPKSREIINQQSEAPGLTLAISTHVQTNSDNEKFRFPQDLAWFNNSEYDPLIDYTAGGASLSPSFNGSSTIRSYTDGTGSTTTLAPFHTFTSADQKAQMLAACMNPLILARNLFLQTITELASRNGQLRNSTEILHIGTQSRDVSDTQSLPAVRAQPTIITSFGQDLTEEIYQLPYISFNSGDSSNTPAEFTGLAPNGILNPSANSDHSTVAAQLRNCFHLYRETANIESTSIKLQRINNNINNYIFEDTDLYTFPEFLASLAYSDWDQDSTDNTKFNAASILSALGSTQSCPYPFTQSNSNPCQKPTIDLRPDLLGLLKYMHGDVDMPANKSPGIFPNDPQDATNKKTPVIIVTHQPITEDERDAIIDYFSQDPAFWSKRHFTIVFFSSNATDSVDNLSLAFNCGEDYLKNNLIVFSPLTINNDADYTDPNDDINFRDYWMDLINPDSPKYIVYNAISIYKSKTTDEWKF